MVALFGTSRHFEYEVDGEFVIVRAADEQQARAALLKRFGFGAKIVKLG